VRRSLPILSCIVIAGAIGSCRKGDAPTPKESADAATGVRKEFGAGPVRLTVELSSGSITTADALNCRMTLRIDDGFEAEFPELVFPDDVPGTILTDYKTRETKEATARLLIREYELEPEYEGTFRLPALQVYFHRMNEIREDMFETEPIDITVSRTPETAEALSIRPVRGLVTVAEMEAHRRRVWPWVVGAVGVVALAALAVYRLRRPRPAPPPPPAHEIALEALRQLVARDYLSNGQVERFFVEITGIVRDYIERAFGLRAPEQTTEEFLANIASAPIVAQHRNALEPFLVAADEVKFARITPEKAAIQRAFDTARDFILQTAGNAGGTK